MLYNKNMVLFNGTKPWFYHNGIVSEHNFYRYHENGILSRYQFNKENLFTTMITFYYISLPNKALNKQEVHFCGLQIQLSLAECTDKPETETVINFRLMHLDETFMEMEP